jgi:hypothetical protein
MGGVRWARWPLEQAEAPVFCVYELKKTGARSATKNYLFT